MPSAGAAGLSCLELALQLLTGLEAGAGHATAPPLWLITRGTQALGVGDGNATCDHAGLWGLARVGRIELPGVRTRCIDIETTNGALVDALASFPASSASASLSASSASILPSSLLALAEAETEVVCRSAMHVPRLVELAFTSDASFQLSVHARGSIDNLYFAHSTATASSTASGSSSAPPAGHVDMAVRAAGLNFRDVLIVLGLYPEAAGESFAPGDDCAGVVSAIGSSTAPSGTAGSGTTGSVTAGRSVGEAVYGSPGFTPGCSCFASHVRVDARIVVPMPPSLSHERACTLPTVYSTVHTAFERMRLHAATPLLLHAAVGGVGLAAGEFARWLDAPLRLTTSKPAKHRPLRELELWHAWSSRDPTAFTRGVSKKLHALRVNGVLNSLSADFIAVSVGLLNEYGRFVEIGKRGVWSADRGNAAIGNATVGNNALHRRGAEQHVLSAAMQLHVIDIAAMVPAHPAWYSRVLSILSQRVARGAVHSLPLHAFDLREGVHQAYRFLQSGASVGKVVLVVPRALSGASAARAAAGESLAAVASASATTVLVTGGLGGLGLLTARCVALEQQGTGSRGRGSHVVLGSRTGRVQPGSEADMASLPDSAVSIALCDVSSPIEVRRLVSSLHRSEGSDDAPQLGTVVHAAGVLADGVLSNQTAAKLRHALTPKVLGARWLHASTSALPLSCCAFFASVVGLLGNAGQGPYAAANAWLDSMSGCRRSGGLAAQSLQWGYVAEIGLAARNMLAAHAHKLGMGLVAREQAERVLRSVVCCAGAGTAVAFPVRHAASIAILPAQWPVLRSQYALCPSLLLPADGASLASSRRCVGDALQDSSATYASGATRAVGAGLASRMPIAPAAAVGLKGVLSLVRRVVGASSVNADAPLMDGGVDSLGAVELRNGLQALLGSSVRLPSTVVFDFPTARLLAAACAPHDAPSAPEQPAAGVAGAGAAGGLGSCCPPAVASMSLAWPGSATTESRALANLQTGHVAASDVPATRWDKYGPSLPSLHMSFGGFLRYVDRFDGGFFGMPPTESLATDPQHRLLLELGYEALHSASERKDSLSGQLVSVGVGICHEDFRTLTQDGELSKSPYASVGYAHSVAAGRLSYVLGLHGPCTSLDVACASALVATQYTESSLLRDGCLSGLAAGVNVMLTPEVACRFANAGMLSHKGRCHTFDARADGYLRAESCCAIVLKPVDGVEDVGNGASSDGLKGLTVRQDGKSASLTAPNGQAQQQLLHAALRFAGSTRAELRSIEAHGTGTPLGDPIEAGSLKGALVGRDGGQPLVLGGVKGNSGHTESAAGLSGLQAVLLAHRHAFAAPNTQLRVLNPHVSSLVDGEKVLTLPVQLAPPAPPLGKGGVSSFGYSGTIAHALLRVCPGRGYTPTPPWAGRVAFHRESLAWPQRRSSKGARAASRDMMVSVRLSCLVDAAEVSTQELKPWTPRGGSFSLSLRHAPCLP